MFKNNLSKTPAIRSIILIRLMVSVVYISEGIQKLLFPADRGAGRFQKIGLLNSEFLGPFVGSIEIICGLFVLIYTACSNSLDHYNVNSNCSYQN